MKMPRMVEPNPLVRDVAAGRIRFPASGGNANCTADLYEWRFPCSLPRYPAGFSSQRL